MGAVFKTLQGHEISHHAKEVWVDWKFHFEWDEWKEGWMVARWEWKVGMKVLAPALRGNNLCTGLVFSILLQGGEEVHGSPGQSHFYLPCYFVSPSLEVMGVGVWAYKKWLSLYGLSGWQHMHMALQRWNRSLCLYTSILNRPVNLSHPFLPRQTLICIVLQPSKSLFDLKASDYTPPSPQMLAPSGLSKTANIKKDI